MDKLFRIALLFFALAISACRETIVVEYTDGGTFTVENLLNEKVTISGSVNEDTFSFTLSPKETYTYYQDLMTGHIENGKTPIFFSTSIKFMGETVGSVEYQTPSKFRQSWKEESDHHFVFKIDNSIFDRDSGLN